MWNTILSGKQWEGEVLNKGKDGTLLWVHTNIIPIKDELGKIVEFISFREDITEHKLAEKKMMEQQKIKAVAEFGGQILHEIMSPVTVLQSHSKNLSKAISSGDSRAVPPQAASFSLIILASVTSVCTKQLCLQGLDQLVDEVSVVVERNIGRNSVVY